MRDAALNVFLGDAKRNKTLTRSKLASCNGWPYVAIRHMGLGLHISPSTSFNLTSSDRARDDNTQNLAIVAII